MRVSKPEKKKLKELRDKHSKEEKLVYSFVKEALNNLKIFVAIKEVEGVLDEELLDNIAETLKIGLERLYALKETYKNDIEKFGFLKAKYTDKKMKRFEESVKTYEEILRKIKDRDGELFKV